MGQLRGRGRSLEAVVSLGPSIHPMPQARSKDPLTAATTSILVPALKPLGFRREGQRLLLRIENDILQRIGFWYSSGLAGQFFHAYYSVNTLFCLKLPEDIGGSLMGGRFWDEVTRAELWPSSPQEVADASMNRILKLVFEQALPYFQRVSSADGVLNLLSDCQQESERSTGILNFHWEFERGCCAVKVGDFSAAELFLRRARDLYAKDDNGLWRESNLARAALCQQLLDALQGGSALDLLEKWKTQTVHNWKLEKVISN